MALNSPFYELYYLRAVVCDSFTLAHTLLFLLKEPPLVFGQLAPLSPMASWCSCVAYDAFLCLCRDHHRRRLLSARYCFATSTINSPEYPLTEVRAPLIFDNSLGSPTLDQRSEPLSDVNLHIKSGEVIGIIRVPASAKSTPGTAYSSSLWRSFAGSVSDGHNVQELWHWCSSWRRCYGSSKRTCSLAALLKKIQGGNPDATDERDSWSATPLRGQTAFCSNNPDKYIILNGAGNVSGGRSSVFCIARTAGNIPSTHSWWLCQRCWYKDWFSDSCRPPYLPDTWVSFSSTYIRWRVWQIIVLDNGRINAIGTHENLKDNPIYRECTSHQETNKVLMKIGPGRWWLLMVRQRHQDQSTSVGKILAVPPLKCSATFFSLWRFLLLLFRQSCSRFKRLPWAYSLHHLNYIDSGDWSSAEICLPEHWLFSPPSVLRLLANIILPRGMAIVRSFQK